MSKIMQYIRIRDEELTTLRAKLSTDPDGAFEYADELADGDGEDVPAQRSRSLDTDRSWDAIGFLLRRHHQAAAHIDVVRGGTRLTEDEWGYEPPRYLTPDEVRQGAAQLAGVPFDALAGHFDPAAMAQVYPGRWHEEEALAYLRPWYDHLAAFFGHAATDHDGMIIFLS